MARGPIPDKPADRPTVPEVLPLVLAYLRTPGNSTGGNLHIILGDRNLEDGSIRWCCDRAAGAGDQDGVEVAEAMLAMTGTQRRQLYWQANAAQRRWYRDDPSRAGRV